MMANLPVSVSVSGIADNPYSIIGAVMKALNDAGYRKEADKYYRRVRNAKTVDRILKITIDLVEVK